MLREDDQSIVSDVIDPDDVPSFARLLSSVVDLDADLNREAGSVFEQALRRVSRPDDLEAPSAFSSHI